MLQRQRFKLLSVVDLVVNLFDIYVLRIGLNFKNFFFFLIFFDRVVGALRVLVNELKQPELQNSKNAPLLHLEKVLGIGFPLIPTKGPDNQSDTTKRQSKLNESTANIPFPEGVRSSKVLQGNSTPKTPYPTYDSKLATPVQPNTSKPITSAPPLSAIYQDLRSPSQPSGIATSRPASTSAPTRLSSKNKQPTEEDASKVIQRMFRRKSQALIAPAIATPPPSLHSFLLL